MILLNDITESMLYIRNQSKQKATSERILIQLLMKEKYEDVILRTLEEEIATLIETVMLHNSITVQ